MLRDKFKKPTSNHNSPTILHTDKQKKAPPKNEFFWGSLRYHKAQPNGLFSINPNIFSQLRRL